MVFASSSTVAPAGSCPCTGVSLEKIAALVEAGSTLGMNDSTSSDPQPSSCPNNTATTPTKTSKTAAEFTTGYHPITSITSTAPSSIFTLSAASSSDLPVSSTSETNNNDSSSDDHVMPEDYSRKLVAQLHRRLDAFLSKSTFIQANASLESLPRLERSDLFLGKTIARGGFSTIIEVSGWTTTSPTTSTAPQLGDQQQQQQEFVVKSLSTHLPLKKIPGAAKDIVLEAHTLSALKHESIIAVRGWCHDGLEGFQTTQRADGFFLVLDKLGDTLFQRVYQWQAELRFQPGTKYANLKKLKQVTKKQVARHQFHEKLQIAVDISSALAYMHERRIIHRDIKSANVAFDPRNQNRAKLIDFGLAAELPPLSSSTTTTTAASTKTASYRAYPLTGNIGTARYMSPEVICERHYNEKADVHSFAVLCWETCAAKKPYDHLDAKHVKDHVLTWNLRPVPYWSWPLKLQRILKRGWARKPQDRPSMAEFHKTLVKVQAKLPASKIDP